MGNKTSDVTGVLLCVLTMVFVLALVGGWVYHGWTMRQWAADRDALKRALEDKERVDAELDYVNAELKRLKGK